jgi:hypothetical protein
VRTPRSRRGYEKDSEELGMVDAAIDAMPLPYPSDLSSELSPATLASIPRASEGFCKFENCSSSVFAESDCEAGFSWLPYCPPAASSCDHGPMLPSVWKLPSFVCGVPKGGSTDVGSIVSSRRGFFRTRRPPRLLPPRTQSSLSRLHRRHGMEPLSSLQWQVS